MRVKRKETLMDAQLKRGVIEILVLASLLRGDSYGYKIAIDVSEVLPISESTLYPILRRLEVDASLTSYGEQHQGRLRKYYKITKTGRDKIRLFLIQWKEIHEVFTYIKGAIDHE
jgi:PadR family transcriptional regulator PadR